MVSFHSSSHSWPTVSCWYTSPDWLVSIGLLSSGPSTSLYHSTAFLHIVLQCLQTTAHSKCQWKVTPYRGDDGWRHSSSPSIENLAICIRVVLTHNCNCDNTRGWVVKMWSRDLCLAVIGVVIVLAYNWWTLINCPMTISSSDHSWPRNCDQSQRWNSLRCQTGPMEW